MDSVFHQIISSPKLPIYFKQLKTVVNEEHKKRKYFYEIITEFQKAEFINEDIIMHSPARIEHLTTSSLLHRLLSFFVDNKNLGFVAVEKALICLSRNDYEPDICYFSNEKANKFKSGQMKFPAPDFIIEILSESTEKNDRGIKFIDYAAHGVQEYWIVQPEKQFVEQYVLKDNSFVLLKKLKVGSNIESTVIKGFKIPAKAIYDSKVNLKTIKEMLK